VKLTRIDDLYRSEYYFLRPDDDCYFLREYTARGGFAGSETNEIVHNIKKSPAKRELAEWHYKERDIKRVARELTEALAPKWLQNATLVPMPPSKSKSDPEYDDRLIRVLHLMSAERALDIRELLIAKLSLPASHKSQQRPRPEEIRRNYSIDEQLADPRPTSIGLFDDVLAAGAHFRAPKDLLVERFPGVPTVGIFYARTIRPQDGKE
jgi:hypothetical protein